jgi:peptidoglycan/xylan/chitin deacetylase (PgdA/CDA1 family)
MYHSISDDPETSVHPYYRTCTSPERFREQMQWLKNSGCRGVTLSEGLAWLNSQPSTLNHKPVSITFDDGFRDFYTTAYPILNEHGFSATVFLPTAFIGDTRRTFTPSVLGPPSSVVRPRNCLTWSEVCELHAAGIEFGSHTVNHPVLYDLGWAAIESELHTSKLEIEARLRAPVTTLGYPYAFPQADRDFTHRFTSLLTECGYRANATTVIGRVSPADNPLLLKRLPANSSDDVALFQAKIGGAYDWLAWPQAAVKGMKRRSPRSPINACDAATPASKLLTSNS